MLFLQNPPKGKKRRRSRRSKTTRKSRGSKMATGRTAKGRIKKGYKLSKGGRVVKVGRKRAKGRSNPARRTRKRRTSSPKRRRTTTRRSNVVRKRRSPARRRRSTRRRRNAPVRARGIVKDLTDGATGAFQVLIGKAAARSVPGFIGIDAGAGAMGVATQAAVALVIGMLAKNFAGATAGKMILAGALSAPVESLVVNANIPILSPALSAYPSAGYLTAYPYAGEMAAYPYEETPAGYLSAYPEAGLGQYAGADVDISQQY